MNENINLDVLSRINNNLYLLDSEGIWKFCEETFYDIHNFSGAYYTFALFLMGLYDDDADALVDDLIYEGWHKWEHFDEWNKYRQCTEDLQMIYEALYDALGGLPSKKNIKENENIVITIDYSAYKNKIDFNCTDCFKIEPTFSSSLPLIDGEKYLSDIKEEAYDHLYVAVSKQLLIGEFSLASCNTISDSHRWFSNSRTSQGTSNRSHEIIYMTINDYIKMIRSIMGGSFGNILIGTALPKHILEKYNLPIYED